MGLLFNYIKARWRYPVPGSFSAHTRYAGAQGIMKGVERTSVHIVSPPFSYLMTHECEPPEAQLVDITFLSESCFNELREVWLNMPIVNPYTFYPADYRSKEEVFNGKGDDPS